MKINPIKLSNLDRLITDYRNHNENIMQYFDYSPFHDFEKRIEDVKNREFNRDQLTDVLSTLNDGWGAPPSSKANIDRLKDENSVVVIGGQQAGLLTGPLYTINKIISIIQLAKQQEKALEVPVIPVFWIAGEDHDYDEINHIYLLESDVMEQHKTEHRVTEKVSISNIHIDDIKTKQWLDKIFSELAETEYTKELYAIVESCLIKSTSYVDFFARFIFELFKDEGLVLIDSGNKCVREIEREYFIKLLENQPGISSSVYKSYQKLSQNGYPIMLDVEQNDTHLFYQKDNERILLVRNERGDWVGKKNEVIFTTTEIFNIAKEAPHLLSNNVVTRPLMQELLFPTLAFVGGNGEINYWSVLKGAFNTIGLTMPPVVPRLSFTYVTEHVNKRLNKFEIECEDVLNGFLDEKKGNWLATHNNPPVEIMFQQLKQTIDNAHRPLRMVAKDIRTDLGEVADNNLLHLYHDLEYLEKSINKALKIKYSRGLADLDLISNSLNPLGGLQERIWNPLPLINEYGIKFFENLVDQSFSIEEEHYLVFL